MSTTTTNPVVLISGGNTGLGFATIQSLLRSSSSKYTILMGTRSVEKGEKALAELKGDETNEGLKAGSEVHVVQLDLDDEAGFERVRGEVEGKFGRLDVLINNAGINLDFELKDGKQTTRSAFLGAYNTNVINTHILTEALAPLLLKSSSPRLIFITSAVGSCGSQVQGGCGMIDKSPEAGWPKKWSPNSLTYRVSKAGENMLALEWRRVLKEDGVKVAAIDPGLLATNLAGFTPEQSKKMMGSKDPIEGGNLVRDVVEGRRDGDDGKLVSEGQALPW